MAKHFFFIGVTDCTVLRLNCVSDDHKLVIKDQREHYCSLRGHLNNQTMLEAVQLTNHLLFQDVKINIFSSGVSMV